MARTSLRLVAALALASVCACAKHVPPPKPPPPPVEEPPPPPPPKRTSDDDGMTVTGTLGTLADEDIAQAFKARWPDVTRCLRESPPRLGYLGGRIELKLRVGPDGAPKLAHVQDSSLGHYAAERCLLELAQGMRFPQPRGGAEAEFSYPIEFRAPRTAAAVTPWEKERVSPEKMQDGLTTLSFCRAQSPTPGPPPSKHKRPRPKKSAAHRPLPGPSGPLRAVPAHLRMTVYIAPGGKVITAGLSADGPLEAAMGTCFVASASSLKLDDPGGRPAKLSFEVVP